MNVATEKQMKYFLVLYKKVIQKMKREYRLYNSENNTLIQMIEAFKRDIERILAGELENTIKRKDMSYCISECLNELNNG